MKTYNTPTSKANSGYVDPETNRAAKAFICGCNQLTPAKEAELDQIFAAERQVKVDAQINEYWASQTENEDSWMNDVPTEDAFEFDE